MAPLAVRAAPAQGEKAIDELPHGLCRAVADGGEVRDQAEEITDAVILEIVRKEYDQGKTPVERLAFVLQRIVPLLEDDARWMVTLRCENRTDIPAPLAPVLGDRGIAGPILPWVTQRGPNGLTRW